jgi:hypothetical protein
MEALASAVAQTARLIPATIDMATRIDSSSLWNDLRLTRSPGPRIGPFVQSKCSSFRRRQAYLIVWRSPSKLNQPIRQFIVLQRTWRKLFCQVSATLLDRGHEAVCE